MSQEDPVYSFSYPSGQPPTPIKTPTSGTFGEDLFETPKPESSFYDPRVTWNTADPCASSPTFLKTPQHSTFNSESREVSSTTTTPTKKRPLSSPDFYSGSASHVHYLSPTPSQSFPIAGESRQFSLSPNPTSSKRNCLSKEDITLSSGLGLELDTLHTMRSARSMQTPPPTSTSASRRKAQQAQQAQQFATNGRRMSSPGFSKHKNPGSAMEQSIRPDQQFMPDKYSVNDFNLDPSGHSITSSFPQQDIFWDPSQNDQMDIDFSSEGVASFHPGSYANTDSFFSSQIQVRTASLQEPQRALYEDFDTIARNSNGHSKPTASSTNQSNIAGVPKLLKKNPVRSKTLGTAVDPSLLFSSPSRAAEAVQGPMPSTALHQDEALQPYAYQIQEAKREKASQGVRKQKNKRRSDVDSPAVKAALQTLREEGINRPGLRRSVTDSVVTCENRNLSCDPESNLPRQNAANKVRRPSSPVKQLQSLARRKSKAEHAHQRTAVTLTIDDSGRARTETKIISDSPGEQPLDPNVVVGTGSESSDTESSSDESDSPIMSQPTSFSYELRENSKPKRGLFVNDSRCHSQKSSYSSVRTSSSHNNSITGPGNRGVRVASALSSSVTNTGLQSSSQSNIPLLSMPRSGGPMIDSFHAGLETNADSQDSSGTAQHELQKVRQTRKQERFLAEASRTQPRPIESSHPNVYLMNQAAEQPYDFTEPFSFGFDAGQNFYTDISPTAITDSGLTAPSIDFEQIGPSIRCVCHIPETDGHLISCESCKKMLHTRCVGINPQRIPKVYLCVFCTGQTPTVRGGRIREPATVGFLQPSSPLAHKSGRSR